MRCRLAVVLAVVVGACGSRTGLDVPEGESGATSAPTGDRVILFGGVAGAGETALGDTWSWDGTAWTQLSPASSPPPVFAAALAPVRSSLVLFGGIGPRLDSVWDETWTWNGGDWTQQFPPASPPATAEMTFGSLLGSVVVCGGEAGPTDTWTWDGANWSDNPARPFPTISFGTAAGPLGSVLVVFGGQSDVVPLFDSTLTWDGTTWQVLSPAHSPPARAYAAMAPFNGVLVLFGGLGYVGDSDSDLTTLADTWIWDGTDWTQANPPISPPARQRAAVAVASDGVVLFGGDSETGASGDSETGALGDTWIWDGTSWTERMVSGPSARMGAAMAGY